VSEQKPTVPELAAAVRIVREAVKDETWTRTPIGVAASQYLRWKRSEWGASPETIRDYRIALARLATFMADKQLSEVHRTDLSDTLDYFWGDLTAGTRAKIVSIWHDFFRWAEEFDLIAEDPSRKLRRPRRTTPDRKTFTPAEVKLLLSVAGGRDRAALELLFGFALRKSALSGLRLGDYEGAYVRILTKGGKRQVLPVADPWLKAVLDVHWQERQAAADVDGRDWRLEYLLHPARDIPRRRADGSQADRWEDRLRPLSGTAMHMWWGRMVAQAAVPYRGMHAARHTRLTELVRFGKGGLKHAQLLAGHANISTTGDIYSHLDVGDLAEVLRLLAADRTEEP
jgi:site-specific recombinase XerD